MREAGKQNKSPAKLAATFGQPHENSLNGNLVAPRFSFHPILFHSHFHVIPGGDSDCEELEIEDGTDTAENINSDLELKLHIMGSKMLRTQNCSHTISYSKFNHTKYMHVMKKPNLNSFGNFPSLG